MKKTILTTVAALALLSPASALAAAYDATDDAKIRYEREDRCCYYDGYYDDESDEPGPRRGRGYGYGRGYRHGHGYGRWCY